MASGALIPKRSDVMSLAAGQSIHDITPQPPQVPIGEPGGNGSSDLFSQIQKYSAAPRYIRKDSSGHSSPIRRSTSAQSTSKYANRQHYQRCIEYLQEQHKHTLTKLHQEVQDLKHENKKLHFRILVEDEGGVASVVKQTLSINTDKTNISNNVLLQETIKDLKVKLNLSEDSLQHQSSTIKALNKHIKLINKKPHPPVERKVAELAPVKNELIEKNKMIVTLEAEREINRKKIDELQQTIRQLRAKADEQKERHPLAASNTSSAHSGSPRTVTSFMVTNSASVSRHNLLKAPPCDSSAPIKSPKLPPLAKPASKPTSLQLSPSSASTGSPRNSLVPKNSRVDIAKRTRRLKQMRQNNIELNEDFLL